MKQVRGTVNAVELLGWLGADPELRSTPNGSKVCRFYIATKRMAGRDGDGKREYETDWTSVEAWEWLAENCNALLHKGSRVLINGSLRTDSWTDKESGQTRYKTYVRADDVMFLDARSDKEIPEEHEPTTAETVEDVPF